jgi:hypothetical protein
VRKRSLRWGVGRHCDSSKFYARETQFEDLRWRFVVGRYVESESG